MRARIVFLCLLISLSASAHNVTEYEDYYEVRHSWICEGRNCSITLNISTELYDYYRNDREHLAYSYQFNESEMQPNYYSFMLSEHDRPLMRAVADEFSRYVLTEKDQIELALSFVQSLPYAFDADSKDEDEYVRYPVETLVDGCGDCEDKVALLVALLYEMDMDFVLLILPEHMAVGVHCDEIEAQRYLLFEGRRYYYLETTMPNWQIGQIPEEYFNAEMEAVPVDDLPNLFVKGVHFESQSALVFEKADCTLQLNLHDLGPGKVTGLELWVWLVENGKRQRVLAEEYFALPDLQEGERRTETLALKSVIKENCTIVMELSGNEIEVQSFEIALDYRRSRRF